jgi:leader peptidase (prepilin peptidase)/N-methyltransferase
MAPSAVTAVSERPSALALGLLLVILLAVAALTDVRRRVIPNRLLIAGAVVASVLIVATDPESLAERSIAAGAAAGVLLAAALAYRGGMGMGDVKLAAVMGLYLGRELAVGLLLAIAAGTIFGLASMAHERGAARSSIPFAPFLALGGVAGLLVGGELIDWYLDQPLTI